MVLRLFAFAACVLMACSPDYAPGTVRGQLVDGAVESGDRIAIIWANVYAQPGEPAAVTENGGRSGGTFWFDFPAPPPDLVLEDNRAFEPNGGRIAYGTVVAYRDNNGNGQLDPIPEGGGPVDTILGASADYWGAFDGNDATVAMEIRYVDGAPPDSPEGLKRGYNILINNKVVPPDTEVLVPLRAAPMHNLHLCLTPNATVEYRLYNACLGPGPLRLMGALDFYNGSDLAYLMPFTGEGPVEDAEVSVNGTPLVFSPSDGMFVNDVEGFLRPGMLNEIIVHRSGHPEVRYVVPVSGDFNIVSPEEDARFRWDQAIELRWTGSQGSADFYVRQSVAFAEGSRGRTNLQRETSRTFPALTTALESELRSTFTVISMAGLYDDGGTNISSYVYRTRRVMLTP